MFVRYRSLRGLPALLMLALLLPAAMLHTARAAGFTPGNLVIYRVGTGADSLVNTGNAVFLDEYTPAGSLVQSIALPTADAPGEKAFVASGTATSEGLLTRSSDGRYLIATGYNRAPGGATSLTSTSAASVPRLIARINSSGNVDTSTALTDYASTNNPRSATSTDGNSLWAVGGNGGVRYATLGSTTSSDVSTTFTNIRQTNIFDGQLYVSSGASSLRLGTVGTGTPTSSGQTITSLPGFPTTGLSSYGFFFTDLDSDVSGIDTLYVADDTNSAGVGGIKKYSLVGGNWTSNGTVGTHSDAYRGLTGSVSGGTVTLYATRKGGSLAAGGGELVSLVDSSGYNATLTGTPTLLATAAGNTSFRGVALAPESGVVVDGAPTVKQTTPADGASDVAVDANVDIVFSEPVTATLDSFGLVCSGSLTHTMMLSHSGAITYTLDPTSDLTPGERCDVSVFADEVVDQDGTPTPMAQDYTFSFELAGGADDAPEVSSTTPISDATGIALSANIVINFSEPVTVTGSWYSIVCTSGMTHTATVSGGPSSFTLNPDSNFATNESCSVSVDKDLVEDQDGDDPPNTMALDYSWSFATSSLTITPIGTVQGAVGDAANGRTHTSPSSGSTVYIQGVIYEIAISRTSGGSTRYSFFIQNTAATADSDPNSSDGIFVFTGASRTITINGGGTYTPTVGDEVILRGNVSEFFNLTQLSSNFQIESVVRSGVNLDAELPPFVAMPPDELAPADRYWERREGMRAAVARGSVTMGVRAEFASTLDAEVWTIPPSHPVAQRADPFQRMAFRDPHPLDNNTAQLFDDGNNYRVLMGSLGVKGAALDSSVMISSPDRPLATTSLTVTGGVYFSFEKYSIQVDSQPSYTNGADPSSNSPPQTPRRPQEYSIASYNVENLYDFRDDPFDGCDFSGNAGCTGVSPPFNYVPASDADYQSRLNAQADQIIQNLRSPDIIMVQEAEDQDICQVITSTLNCGSANNADGKPDTIQELALTIAAHGGPAYDAAYDRNGADARGIVTALLYRKDRVELIAPTSGHPVLGSSPSVSYRGAALSYNSDVQNPKSLNAVLPGDVDNSTGQDGTNVFTRAPLTGYFRIWRTFVGRGDSLDFYLINNHFSSTPDARVGQRTEQANYAAAISKAIQDAQPEARVLIGGDFNVFPRPDDPFAPGHSLFPSDQLRGLYDQGLYNLWTTMAAEAPSNAYSYIFSGQAQTLDSMFVSAPLSETLVQARVALINAGWKPAHSGTTARGWSDHNPTVARFAIHSRPILTVRDVYDSGLGLANAEIIAIRGDYAVTTNGANGSVDILDASNLPALTLIERVDLPDAYDDVNSVAIHPSQDYALFVSGVGNATGTLGVLGAIRLSDGTLVATATVGIHPDSVGISYDGMHAVVANEAEAPATGQNGGPGSLSWVDLSGFNPASSTTLSVTAVTLESQNGSPGFSTGRTDDIGRVAIDNTPNTLEPETVAFSHDSQYAYITLQENNGVVRLRLSDLSKSYFGLGQSTRLADLTNGGGYNPLQTLTAFREPDGIALTPDGMYFVTSDEGDTRNAAGSGAPRGGRSVSIFDALTGALVADTGSQLDDLAYARGVYPDNRSDRGGSEPEVLDLALYGGRTIVAVGLERANAVALIDISDPTKPVAFELLSVGLRPEGVKLFVQHGALYVLAPNEDDGTVSVAAVPVQPLTFRDFYTEDTQLSLENLTVGDADGDMLTVSIQLPGGMGTLSTGSVGDASSWYDGPTGMYTATGSIANLNSLLATLIFTPALNVNAKVTAQVAVSDGTMPDATGTLKLKGTAVNDAPMLAQNSGLTLAEGASKPLSGTLTISDVESLAGAIVYTVTQLPANGTLSNDGSPLALNASFTQAELDDGSIVYTHNGGETTSDSLVFSASDGSGGTIGSTSYTITITPVNDAPTISSTGMITGATAVRPFTITYAMLAAASDEADVEGDTISFRIEELLSGTLLKGGVPVTPGVTLLGPGESLVYYAPRGGTLDAFTVRAYDGASASAGAATVRVKALYASFLPTIRR